MTEEDRIGAIYTNIGRFAVEFQQICHTIECGIRCILVKEGLESDRIQEILLAGLTAEPLSALFHSLCYEHLKPDTETAKVIDSVFSTFKNLISARNDLLHGKWFLAEENFEGRRRAIAFGQKLHKKKTGSATKEFKHDTMAFEGLVINARTSLLNLSKLTNCISGCYPIVKNFQAIENGKYQAINGLCVN
jgi:hypothetical protein